MTLEQFKEHMLFLSNGKTKKPILKFIESINKAANAETKHNYEYNNCKVMFNIVKECIHVSYEFQQKIYDGYLLPDSLFTINYPERWKQPLKQIEIEEFVMCLGYSIFILEHDNRL